MKVFGATYSRRNFLLGLGCLFGFSAPALGQGLERKAPVGLLRSVRIAGLRDENTLIVLLESDDRLGVRLHGVTMPPATHPLHRQARRFMTGTFLRRQAVLEVVKYLDATTVLGTLETDLGQVVEVVVANGMGWCTHPQLFGGRLGRLEAEAKRKHLGVWRDDVSSVRRLL